MSQKKWLGFSKTALAAAAAMVVVMPAMAQEAKKKADQSEDDGAPRAKEDTVRLGTIVISGEGGKLGTGQMLNEDAAKARSTVTRAATEKDRSTGNPYQALAMLPGVNTFSYDATGLYGGGLTVRGFNSDQMGFTINGVPVNDSGSFSVYPQEYADQENLCTQSINQGSPDSDSPAAGATGGNVTITSCDPEDKRRVRFTQTLGELNLTRSFLRYDTGRFFNNSAKVFVSYSHTEGDKWKGEGKAKKDHIDAAFRWDINEDNKVLGSVLYNRAINNNIFNPSLAQLAQYGYYGDFSTKFPGHMTPVKGAIQDESVTRPTPYLPVPAYYKLANNPFENAIVSMSGSFKLATDTYLKVQPYLWYGYGNGGTQQTTLKETGFYDAASGKLTGVKDLNGDGDTLDTIAVARASVTKTYRPGVTTEVNTQLGNHNLRVGLWYERARHGQTQPAVTVDNSGNPATVWLDSSNITRADGSLYQGRDWYTVSTAYQAYVMDNWSFMDDRGMLTLGVRTPHVTRDFTGNANESFAYNYKLKRDYDDVLPQAGLRFNLDKSQQVFVNVSKNFRAPPNYAFANSTSSINVQADASGKVSLITELKPETSIMTDIGYRYQSKALSLSATFFNSDFKNRQATAFDPNTNFSANINAGRVNVRGMEFEAGTGVFKGFSAYGSLTVQHSELKDNLITGKSGTATTTGAELPTAGKTYVLTPHTMVGLSVQYEYGPFYGRLKVKRTGHQYATMTNDEEVPAYTVGDFDAGYKIGDIGNWASNVMLRLNVSNIGNTRYRNPASSQTNALPYNGSRTSTVFYYLGAPRFTSVGISADF